MAAPSATHPAEHGPAARQVCRHCRRPSAVCYCAHLVALPTRTRVVFLQHPREAKVPIGTARMAHLMLPNSELHQGVLFGDHPRVRQIVADPCAALLFPDDRPDDRPDDGMQAAGPAASPARVPLGAAGECPVRTLVVVDGTWAQTRKVLKDNPILTRLPRIGLVPERPGNYRIRREPAPECLATIEAVAQVLGVLEQAPQRFADMLAAFTFMVDRQIALADAHADRPRRRRCRAAAIEAAARAREIELERLSRAVVVHAEVNAHPRDSGLRGQPELLHLVARRLSSGEIFQAVVAPRRALADSAPFHLDLSRAVLLSGEPIATALRRWAAFARPGDVYCGWGHFTADLLAAEGDWQNDWPGNRPENWLDLRLLVARRRQASPGTPAQAALALGAPAALRLADGRAGQVVAELEQIVAALRS